MSRKPNQGFGALPATRKRLPCDFSAMRGGRARKVNIRCLDTSSTPGHFRAELRNFSRAARGKNPIRSGSMENMRGALSEIQVRKPKHQMRRSRGISLWGARRRVRRMTGSDRSISASDGSARDFFLFYLTGVRIFDNRHGLLKKLDSARTAETLSAVKPRD